MNEGNILVSGCPRSGTSLMMGCMSRIYGEDMIFGEKFPMLNHHERMKTKKPFESDGEYNIRMYCMKKENPDKEKMIEKSKDMNPMGFWECKYTVQGLRWRRMFERMPSGKIMKVVSQGLMQTNPDYVNKIIFMLRNPRAVAKSQERLTRNLKMYHSGKEFDINDEKIHTPEMFINVTVTAARWIKYYKPEILYVEFDKLVANPKVELSRVTDFMGYGDADKAVSYIKPKLKRSEPEDVKHELWPDADEIYDNFIKRDFDKITKIAQDKTRTFNMRNNGFMCLRSGLMTVDRHCDACLEKRPKFLEQLKSHAEKMKIDWKDEPCVYECGMNPKIEPKSIEESITNNHWL